MSYKKLFELFNTFDVFGAGGGGGAFNTVLLFNPSLVDGANPVDGSVMAYLSGDAPTDRGSYMNMTGLTTPPRYSPYPVEMAGGTDITVEGWFSVVNNGYGSFGLFSAVPNVNPTKGPQVLSVNNSGLYGRIYDSGTTLRGNFSIGFSSNINNLYHIAIVREGLTEYVYGNGVLKGSYTYPTLAGQQALGGNDCGVFTGAGFNLGTDFGDTYNPRIHSLRITKNARYLAADAPFTPAAASTWVMD